MVVGSLIVLAIAFISIAITVIYWGFLNARLLYGSEIGRNDMVKSCLRRGANPNMTDEGNVTPLMAAALNGHDDIVDLLIQYGAKVNTQNEQGYTALMYSASLGDISAVRSLCAAGAKIETKNGKGLTALECAKENNRRDVVTFLNHNRIGITQLNAK